MNNNYNDEFEFPAVGQRSFKDILNKQYDADFLREANKLLSACLMYDPTKRIKPFAALTHPFFYLNELREETTTLPNGDSLPDIFKFE